MDRILRQKIINVLFFGSLITFVLMVGFCFVISRLGQINKAETKTVNLPSKQINAQAMDTKVSEVNTPPTRTVKPKIVKRQSVSKKRRDAYKNLSPRMKEEVCLKALRDFGRHPEKYYVVGGTIHLKPGD